MDDSDRVSNIFTTWMSRTGSVIFLPHGQGLYLFDLMDYSNKVQLYFVWNLFGTGNFQLDKRDEKRSLAY